MAATGHDERLLELGRRLAPSLSSIAARLAAQLAVGERSLRMWMDGLFGGAPDGSAVAALPQPAVLQAISTLRGEYEDQIAALYEPGEARLVARAMNQGLDVELARLLQMQRDRTAASAGAAQVAAMQTLSSGLAHEVRNPLNSARLQLELLERRLRRSRDDRALLEPVAHVHQELERLTRMLNDFLAFARPSPVVADRCDVIAVIRDVVALEQPVASERGIGVTLAGVASVITEVDPRKLQQIVSNLVRNAIEASPVGGQVRVTVEGEADGGVEIAVEDQGGGIAAEIQRRIYEPFFSTKPTGTGLGLSIVHSAVALHGGTLELKTGPSGTRFEVRLPRVV